MPDLFWEAKEVDKTWGVELTAHIESPARADLALAPKPACTEYGVLDPAAWPRTRALARSLVR